MFEQQCLIVWPGPYNKIAQWSSKYSTKASLAIAYIASGDAIVSCSVPFNCFQFQEFMDLIANAGSLSSSDLTQKKAELKLKHKVF